jgi:nudix-type nucleoside diphosphatase (YffH/AdpP family)
MDPVKIIKEELLSDNWYTLKKYTYEILKRDGRRQLQTREVYDRGNGAAILLYNKENKKIILTRQFRLPSFVNGNKEGDLIEACAGLLDQDNPEEAIKRETEEETGYRIKDVRKIFEAYMSPGSVSEILYFFIAEYSASMKVHEGGGIEHEQEDIEVLELDFEKALSAANRSGVLAVNFDGNFARGQFPNDGEQASRRQSGRAGLVHIRFKTSAHPDIQVGSGEMHRSLFGLQQNVGKNWQRGPGADDVLNLLQTFEKLLFRYAKFHEGG